jgi:hypothetical protein
MHPLLAEGMDFAYGIEEHKEALNKYRFQPRSPAIEQLPRHIRGLRTNHHLPSS